MEDVENSQAVQFLNIGLQKGELTEERAAELRGRFTELHGHMIQLMGHEKALLEEAWGMKVQVEEESLRFQSASGRGEEDSSVLNSLREDAEQAEAEATMCREREQELQREAADWQRQRDEKRQQLEDAERDYAAAMEPQIAQCREDIENLTGEVMKEEARLGAATKERATALKSHEASVASVAELKAGRENLKKEKLKAEQLPETFRKQAEMVNNQLTQLKGTENRLLAKIKDLEQENTARGQRIKELNEEHAKAAANLERGRLGMDQKEKAMDQTRKEMEVSGIEHDTVLADQVKLDLQLKSVTAEERLELDNLNRKQKERDMATRKLRSAEVALGHAKGSLPALDAHRDQARHALALEESTMKKLGASIAELKKEVDIYMNGYLKKEQQGKEKTSLFQQSYAEVAELEKEVVAMKREEQARERFIAEFKGQRERVSRQTALKTAKWRETEELVQVKDLIVVDLKKKRRDTNRRLRDLQQLYDLIKSQRNKFVNMIQTSSQSIAEMKEKLKILGNEIEILRTEAADKERLPAKARTDHANAQIERDHLRSDLNKCILSFRERQGVVEEQITEIDKLNSIINTTERDMLRLKKQYETSVEERNYSGVMLIDRNDELCILYEKVNLQEEVLRQGEISLWRREDEIRVLNIAIRDMQYSIDVTRKTLPQIPHLDESIASLQHQLLEAREEAEALEAALETPGNKSRWRYLDGKIPEKAELVTKINQLEERLNDKKEQLLEKNLILEEVMSLSHRLRDQAAEGRADTLELARKVNGYQSRTRALTRKMMATVSELSMYQATSLKLEGEKEGLEAEEASAEDNLQRGLAPNADAEREWQRMEHERLQLREMARAAAEHKAAQENPAQVVHTTAEPRPNAYVPADIGIPKPYGRYAPFKPSEEGSTMRHIRKPEPREIVI